MSKHALHVLASMDATGIRKDSMFGRDFLVVPVVMLMQGVLFPANADDPELALFSEFAKLPDGWNGRPLMMNHPRVDGNPVGANSPAILEAFSFGQIFNTTASDPKLQAEAWIDLERVTALGGEVQETVDRLNAGENVEVSTGLYSVLQAESGIYNGMKYNGVWREIVPDHLAFLSKGLTGACSNEMGCGAPRINSSKGSTMIEFKNKPKINCSCTMGEKVSNGGSCTCPANRHNSYPEGMTQSDVYTLLSQRISYVYGAFAYLMDFTQDSAIFQVYNGDTYSYYTYSIDYTIDDTTTCTLVGEPIQVNVLTRIEPVTLEASKKPIAPVEHPAEPVVKVQTPEEPIVMTTKTPEVLAAEEAARLAAAPATETTTTTATSLEANPVINTKKTPTMEEYLNDAPPAVRAVLNESMRVLNEKKVGIIKTLTASGRCDFTEDELKVMEVPQLEKLAKLAAVPSYAGSSPRNNANHELVDNDMTVPPAPIPFPVKTAA